MNSQNDDAAMQQEEIKRIRDRMQQQVLQVQAQQQAQQAMQQANQYLQHGQEQAQQQANQYLQGQHNGYTTYLQNPQQYLQNYSLAQQGAMVTQIQSGFLPNTLMNYISKETKKEVDYFGITRDLSS